MLGIFCKLYRNTGTYASPTWNETDNIKDLDYKLTSSSFDATTRKEGGLMAYEPTLDEFEVSFGLRMPEASAITGDTQFDDYRALLSVFSVKSAAVEVMVLTDAHTVNGTEGFRCFMKIHEFSESQANDAKLFKNVVMKPCPVPAAILAVTATAVMARRVRIAGGVPTYSAWNADSYT